MLYLTLLGLHIAAGVLGLIIGAFAFRPPRAPGDRALIRYAYLGSLTVLVVAVIGAVAAHWPTLDPVTQVVFSGLGALGVFVIARGFLALRSVRRKRGGWQKSYMRHIYFTYISLWEGFVIVAVIDLGLPGWLVPVVAVGVLILGGYLVNRYQRQVLPSPAASRVAGTDPVDDEGSSLDR